MTYLTIRCGALALAVLSMGSAVPASAAPARHSAAYQHSAVWGQQGRQYQQSYGEPVYANTRVWQGDDGRYYCKRSNGTTGLIIGGAGGALIGREIAGRGGDRTLGAILGAAGGALLGRAIDTSGARCR